MSAMLRTLRIRNLVIVDDVTVEFGPGLNLLTGETGAGKSILVDALALVAGARADRSAVRGGRRRAVVEALFDTSDRPDLVARLEEAGYPPDEEGQCVVRREIAAGGAGRVLVNGSPSSLTQLRELAAGLIELHGQHEQQGLLRPERQLAVLDAFAEHDAPLARVAATAREVRRAREALDATRARLADADEARSRLTETLRTLEELAPRPGELAALELERTRLRSAHRIGELLDEVLTALGREGPGAARLLTRAAGRADALHDLDPSLEELAGRVRSAAIEVEDLAAEWEAYRDRAESEPGRLDAVEARRAEVERACLRFATDEEGLAGVRDRAAEELATLEGGARAVEASETALGEAVAAYALAAGELGSSRRSAATKLGKEVGKGLADLALQNARIAFELTPAGGDRVGDEGEELPLSERGAERAEIRFGANPGEPLRPLHQAASGGELSRVLLALYGKGGRGGAASLVFDEIDAGVSGAVADAVGGRLSDLARTRQVLCVSHLPQVAAYGDRHLRVAKTVRGGRTSADVRTLDDGERIEELARMLGGKEATDTSRRHARELRGAAAGRGKRATGRRRA